MLFGIPRLLVGLIVAAVQSANGEEASIRLREFRVESTSWQYAKIANIEILSQVGASTVIATVSALLRGERLVPDLLLQGTNLRLMLVLVEGRQLRPDLPPPMRQVPASPLHWDAGYTKISEGYEEFTCEETQVIALNFDAGEFRQILMDRVYRRIQAKRPRYPAWFMQGLFGGLYQVIGIPHSTTVRFAKLSWPDPRVEPGVFPRGAGDFPSFAGMFDPISDQAAMTEPERWRYEFQAALFARWSLFGPVKNGRNRNGYWALAEWARLGKTDEQIFRECYGMSWAQACDEMRAYLRTKAVGMLDVRMPHVMTKVPEADALELREATPDEMRRILGEYARLAAMCERS